MRHDAPFLVKRYAPMIGRPDGPKRVTMAFQTYALAEAQRWADTERQRAWRAVFWIERRGQSATRPRKSFAERRVLDDDALSDAIAQVLTCYDDQDVLSPAIRDEIHSRVFHAVRAVLRKAGCQ
jgi:hypothetical protein